MYPNPNTGRFNIDFPQEPGSVIRVFDLAGKIVHESVANRKNSIELSDCGPELYFVEVTGNYNLQEKLVIFR